MTTRPVYPDADSALDHAAADGRRQLTQTLSLERTWRDPPDRLLLDVQYQLPENPAHAGLEAQFDGHRLQLDQPVLLIPAEVPKPWGREIWLSGIEARGESAVQTAAGALPLSQYLALAPRRLCGGAHLVLLKILDPLPQPVQGDLYFETHEEKQEIYVVTHVDPGAWPDGAGAIRFGMDQELRRRYGDDEALRRDYLDAVRAYERVRRAIDDGRAGDDEGPEREAELRAAMNAFTALKPLRVGDVVAVPTWLPHSLQHGVRVIEFQTPTYERYIISFAQKVLTQDHWDSAAAIARMRLDVPAEPRFEPVGERAECIVSFDDFRVWRVTLPPGAEFELPRHPSYLLCAGVRGSVGLGALTVEPEQAAFVPALALRGSPPPKLRNAGDSAAVALIAAPDL